MESYFSNIPDLHSWDGGVTWNSGGFTGPGLRAIHDRILAQCGPGSRLIETGAGNSTIAMLLTQPRQLVTVNFERPILDRVLAWCAEHAIATDALTLVQERSEWVLPGMAREALRLGSTFDVALIDGGHGWPTVFVDFCYLNSMLRQDGLLLVDDIALHSIKELARFLLEQPDFALLETIDDKCLVFRKTSAAREPLEWTEQPYVVRMSQPGQPAALHLA